MTVTTEKPLKRVREPFPGALMLRRVLWLLVVAAASGFAYSMFLLASKGGGFGGVDSDGSYIDADGNPTTAPPVQINVVAHASPAIPVLLGVIVLAGIILALRVSSDERPALRVLNVTMVVVAAVAVCSLAAGYAWFLATPLDYWTGSGTHFTGFPFAAVDVTTGPIPR